MALDSFPRLAFDIILFEILTRASPETVARCRLVSKTWNQATYEPYFYQLFLQRTKIVSGFYVQSLKYRSKYLSTFISMDNNMIKNPHSNILSLSFLPNLVKIKATTKQGLLLCEEENPKTYGIPQYIVCKPTTHQWLQIPNPKTRYFTKKFMMIVLGSNPIRYKIIRFSQHKHDSFPYKLYATLRCEIFCSEKSAWKCLPENIRLPYYEFLEFKSMVSVSGFLYSLTSEKRLFVFDIVKESWNIFSLSQHLCEINYCSIENMKLLEYEGKLGLLCMVTEECMELWMMSNNSNGQMTWSLRKKENLQSLIRKEPYAFLTTFYNNDLAWMSNYNKVIFPNFQTSISNEVEYLNLEFFRVESDWEPVQLFNKPSKRLPRRSTIGSIKRSSLRSISSRTYPARRSPPEFIFICFLIVVTLFFYILDS